MSSRLLILDDDPHIGRMVQLIGESVGLEARFMTGTEDFFRSVADWRPTHIAIDLVMPEMDGVEVLQRLADGNCTAKIIITSGVGSRVLDAAGRSANEHGLEIVGVLSKPFSPRQLRDLLAGARNGEWRREEPSLFRSGRREAIAAAAMNGGESTAESLRRALERRELQLRYQPQIRCASGELAGFEALVRWIHPERGEIMPDQFIGCAEQYGLIDALTDQVMQMAIEWLGNQTANSEVTVAVNLSSRATAAAESYEPGTAAAAQQSTLVDRITALCRAGGIRPENLVLELTESSAMENPVMSLDLFTRLRMKGFQLSIDDFGTGYSSMLQLVRLPFSEIKVDKSFVKTATASGESRAVVESIIGLGHSLGLRVVAEGVEDEATLRYLRDSGCDLAQGFFIARPMPGDAAAAWMRSEAKRFQTGVHQRPLL